MGEITKMKDIWGIEHDAKLIAGDENSPYFEYEYVEIHREKQYNPNYGDNRKCICGHSYYRHFDSWDHMRAVGCKYCGCYEFVEAKEELEEKEL
jgi:hypothetical protein